MPIWIVDPWNERGKEKKKGESLGRPRRSKQVRGYTATAAKHLSEESTLSNATEMMS